MVLHDGIALINAAFGVIDLLLDARIYHIYAIVAKERRILIDSRCRYFP